MRITRISIFIIGITIIANCSSCHSEQWKNIAILHTADTQAYTDPCGCCGGQKGGLPARATYLVDYKERLEQARQGNSAKPAAEQGEAVMEADGDDSAGADASTGNSDIPGAGNSENAGEGNSGEGVAGTSKTASAGPGGKKKAETESRALSRVEDREINDYQNDVRGRKVKGEQRDRPVPGDFLLVDCGSFSNNETPTSTIQSHYTARSYGLLGYDAVNLGEREIRLPQALLAELIAELAGAATGIAVPVVTANVSFTPAVDSAEVAAGLDTVPFTRITLDGGQPVFVTGVVSASGLQHGLDRELGYQIAEPAGALKRVLAEARPSELVVVLVSGITGDELAGLLAVERVDVIVGVAPQDVPEEYRKKDEPLDKLILPVGEDRGRVVGRCEFTYAGASELTINEIGYDALPRRMPKHPLLVQLLEEMRDEVTAHHVARQAEQEKLDLAQLVDYVGRTACAECHNEIFTGFLSTRHAHAIETLAGKDEQRNGLCLPCHTTGFNAPTGFTVSGRAAGLDCVGCEQCHGPGEVHIQLKRGAELTGPMDGLNRHGLVEVTEQTCRECHVETTNPDFNYELKLPLIDHGTSRPAQ